MSEVPQPLILRDLAEARIVPITVPGVELVCNPSVARDGDGFRALIRAVNYRLKPNGYHMPVAGGIGSTMWMATFDRALEMTGVEQVDDSGFRHGRAERGFEDGRLFRRRGEWWFSATALERVKPVVTAMALCRLEGARIAACSYIRSPLQNPFEKNWMPLARGDSVVWIYRISPMQVVRGVRDEIPEFAELNPGLPRFHGWSGSSQCVRYRGRWLCVLHRRSEPAIRYDHAFVEFDDAFRITRASADWRFENERVEFCAGLCFAGEDAILSYGVMDREARILRMPLQQVEAMLSPGVGGGLRAAIGRIFRRGE